MKPFLIISGFAIGFALIAFGLSREDSFAAILSLLFYELFQDKLLLVVLAGIPLVAYLLSRIVAPTRRRYS
ncbi:hypothetical protein [Pelagicoccus sp. SDUM812003]|uniref:hypothetical protein n=1 Tax=Pelagicoccus sp. SDUM812003 TaxID=3041267 RepID=UPI00280DE701|nr:hypothetical protein [Pelagicoccus sp. SDUM812003]MDQ8204716.1 hypothetical protein [Pelagicoccus sp. SDUM812003]